VPRVTALRPRGRDRVAVEVDGAEWRVVPVQVISRAGICTGLELDRPHLRAFRRELRRSEALSAAARALRHRDLTTAELRRRLETKGTAPSVRDEAVAALERVGWVDDERYAVGRALTLAGRGAGNLAISADLERRGLDESLVLRALAELAPEEERARAVVRRRGAGTSTARYLARKGFSEAVLEALLPVDVAKDA
jgi:regulatory protein